MLTINKILFATNCSESAQKMFGYTLAVAKYFRAEVHVLYVCELKVDTMAPSIVRYQLLQEEKHRAEQELANFIEQFSIHQMTVVQEVEIGFAKENIPNYLHRNNSIDLVVLGLNDTTPRIQKAIWGTTILTVLEESPVPVLVIPKGILFQDIKNMAYLSPMTDHWENSYEALHDLATYFKANLLVAHLQDSNYLPSEKEKNHYVLENYAADLQSFIHNENLQLLVTITSARNTLQRFLKYSAAQKMALRATIPLLVWKK
jgi:nucleotide-binding universal stress UspA family protein